jgi:anti-sigma factor RsiW
VTALSPRDVACVDLVELLTDYLEGALPPDEVEAVDRHLELCEGCRVYLDQLRLTIDALGAVPVESLSDDAVDSLLSTFRGLTR